MFQYKYEINSLFLFLLIFLKVILFYFQRKYEYMFYLFDNWHWQKLISFRLIFLMFH